MKSLLIGLIFGYFAPIIGMFFGLKEYKLISEILLFPCNLLLEFIIYLEFDPIIYSKTFTVLMLIVSMLYYLIILKLIQKLRMKEITRFKILVNKKIQKILTFTK